MSNAQFIHNGDTIDYTPASAVSAGDVVVQGELVGIAKLDIAAGQLGALSVVGVFDVPKAAGANTDIAAGAKVYWNEADRRAEKTDNNGAYKLLGKAVRSATTSDVRVRVRLTP